MGITCGTRKKQSEALIQNQIKLAVQEDENLNKMDNSEPSDDPQIEQNVEQSQQPDFHGLANLMKRADEHSDDEDAGKQKKKVLKKKTAIKRDDNYLKIIEYHDLRVKYFALVTKEEDITTQYELTIGFYYQEYMYSANCKAIIMCEATKPFYLTPITYQEAASNSQYQPFFIQDTYFNIDLQLNSNLQSFNQLLEVRRNFQTEKQEEQQQKPTQMLTRRQTKQYGNTLPSPTKTKRKKRDGTEMMELIHLFDLEASPRLNQLLITLMIFQYKPKVTKNLITINDIYFLFNEKPSLDKQEIHRVLIFYEHFDYNLQELSDHLIKKKLTLSHITHMQLSMHLLQILYNCYSSYLYRLNFTLNTIFWVSKAKRFKLQTFGRIQNLLVLDGKDDAAKFKNANEQKSKIFHRDFDRDFGAILDIILHFKELSKDIPTIKKMRRKRKNLPEGEQFYGKYICLYDETFTENEDSVFQGLVRLKFFENNSFDQVMEEIKSVITTLEKQIKSEIAQKQKKKEEEELQKEQTQQQSLGQFNDIESDSEDPTQVQSFNILIERAKKDQLEEEASLYYQMIYSSILYAQNFNLMCDNYMSVARNQQQIAYTQIQYSIWKKLNSIVKEGFSSEQQSTLQNISKSIGQLTYTQDSFNYYLLLELVTKMKDKPISIISSLKQLIQEQNIRRRRQIKPKLSSNQRYNGIIEMRKALILDIFFIDYFVSVHLYNRALSLMQQDITSQLKFNLKNYLLYNQSLFLNGLLNERTLQTISAMLNLEISKILYDAFFPNFKTVYIEDETQRQVTKEQQDGEKTYTAKTIFFDNQACENLNVLDFHLGKVYFSLHDKENALKCLRRVKHARQKKFDMLSDEVIEVIIEILKILVEQDDSGAAGEICYEYKQKFRESYKKNFYFKSRYVARLQLIMAAVFECNGMIISSLRYYQKANRTFNQSKTNSYILQIHIRQQIMKLISGIRVKANLIKTLLKGYRSVFKSDFNYNHGYLSEIVKPYFNNQFLRKTVEIRTTFENPIVFNYLLSIFSLFRHEEYEKVEKKLNKLIQTLKKRKVDESYGITLEKLASQNVIENKYQDAINHFLLAIDIHERYLLFPQKESHILRCHIFILCCYSLLEQKNKFQDQLNTVDQFIAQIYETLRWSNIPYQSYSNKFRILVLKLGKSFLYQMQDLSETIEKFQKVRYKLIQNLQNPQKLKIITQKYLKLRIKDTTIKRLVKKQSVTDKRQSCIFGLLSQQNIVKSRKSTIFQAKELIKNSSQSEFEVLETQKTTQHTTTRSHQPSRDTKDFSLLVVSEKQPSIGQSEPHTIQKSVMSEENLETERVACGSNQFSIKDKSKCSTGMPSQVLLTMTPISERQSIQYKQKNQKGVKPFKIDPFQKTKKK